MTEQAGWPHRYATHLMNTFAPPARLLDADGPLACAITAELARGSSGQTAVESALSATALLNSRSFQPGMGHRLINRSTK